MSAFLGSAVLPALGLLHAPRSQLAPKHPPSGRDGVIAPLVRFARRPVGALENLIEDFRPRPSDDALRQKQIEERTCVLRLKLQSAATLAEWQAAATELDRLEGNDLWKEEDVSDEYNYHLVKASFDNLEEARISCDPARMLFLIRTSLSRHLGGMGNLHLYKHSHIGTKWLIERYIRSALETLSSLLEITRRTPSMLDPRIVLEQVVSARQAFGRSALLLSGGGTFGMNHIGVVKCLWEMRLLPRIISGASAGSIVSAVICTRKDEEVPGILQEFCNGDLQVFTTAENDSPMKQVVRLMKTGALFDVSNLIRVMKGLLGDLTFQEAYNRTRRILNIPVSSAGVFELPRLLNYVSAPNVIIWSAVAASCSVPVLFSSADILAKDPKTGAAVHWNPTTQRWIDGSVDNDLPMTRLAEMFNVNHFIVSQVNPHVTPFIPKEERNELLEDTHYSGVSDGNAGWLPFLAGIAKDETMHRMAMLSEVGVFPNLMTKLRSILSQRYYGDITILPEVSVAQLHRVLRNPDPTFMAQAAVHGERATWPKLSRIQNHCAIELALDDAVYGLRARIAFSPSQVDLRLNMLYRPPSRAASEGDREEARSRKNLRFSQDGENEASATRARHSRPASVHEQSLALSKARTESSVPSAPDQLVRSARRRRLAAKPPDSPPMFSTASDGDDDTDSGANSGPSTTTPEASLAGSASDEDDSDAEPDGDYFARPVANSKAKRLFPHSSQPSTPWGSNIRRSRSGSHSPVLPSSFAPLSMTSYSRHDTQLAQTPSPKPLSSFDSSVSLPTDGDTAPVFVRPYPGSISADQPQPVDIEGGSGGVTRTVQRSWMSSSALRSLK